MKQFTNAKNLLLGAVVCAVLFADGCGGSSGTQLRVMNASPNEGGVDVVLDGSKVATNVTYGGSTGYLSVSSATPHVQIDPTGLTTPVIDTTPSVATNTVSTMLVLDFSASLSSVVLTDDNTDPASGQFKLRIVNASPSVGTMDAYVVLPGTDISTVQPNASGIGFGAASAYLALPSGPFEVYLTLTGSKVIAVDSGALTFSSAQIRTLVALNNNAGGYTDVVLSDKN